MKASEIRIGDWLRNQDDGKVIYTVEEITTVPHPEHTADVYVLVRYEADQGTDLRYFWACDRVPITRPNI